MEKTETGPLTRAEKELIAGLLGCQSVNGRCTTHGHRFDDSRVCHTMQEAAERIRAHINRNEPAPEDSVTLVAVTSVLIGMCLSTASTPGAWPVEMSETTRAAVRLLRELLAADSFHEDGMTSVEDFVKEAVNG